MVKRSPMYLHRLRTNDRKRFQIEGTGTILNKAKYLLVLIVITEVNYHLQVYLLANLNIAVSLPKKDFFDFQGEINSPGEFGLIKKKNSRYMTFFVLTSLTVRRSYELYWPRDSSEIGADPSTLIIFSRQLYPVVGTTHNRTEFLCSSVECSLISLPCVCLFCFCGKDQLLNSPTVR